jgi:hypothetical protein
MYFFSEVFPFSVSVLVYRPKSQNSRPLSGARLELVDDNGDWHELREDSFHRPGILAMRQMMNTIDEAQGVTRSG